MPRSTLQAWRAYQENLDECPVIVAFFHSPPGHACLHCLVLVLEQVAFSRDHDTWNVCMEQALAGLNCRVIQSTSDEAPGLLAYGEHHLGAYHSPDLFHVQHALRKAVSAPMAAKVRAAAKVVVKAAAGLRQVQERLHTTPSEPAKRAPGCPAKAAAHVARVD